jgi:hypothetical protein
VKLSRRNLARSQSMQFIIKKETISNRLQLARTDQLLIGITPDKSDRCMVSLWSLYFFPLPALATCQFRLQQAWGIWKSQGESLCEPVVRHWLQTSLTQQLCKWGYVQSVHERLGAVRTRRHDKTSISTRQIESSTYHGRTLAPK